MSLNDKLHSWVTFGNVYQFSSSRFLCDLHQENHLVHSLLRIFNINAKLESHVGASLAQGTLYFDLDLEIGSSRSTNGSIATLARYSENRGHWFSLAFTNHSYIGICCIFRGYRFFFLIKRSYDVSELEAARLNVVYLFIKTLSILSLSLTVFLLALESVRCMMICITTISCGFHLTQLSSLSKKYLSIELYFSDRSGGRKLELWTQWRKNEQLWIIHVVLKPNWLYKLFRTKWLEKLVEIQLMIILKLNWLTNTCMRSKNSH